MNPLRTVFSICLAVLTTWAASGSALGGERQTGSRFLQRAVEHARAFVTPGHASTHQHRLLAVNLAATETGITDPAEIAAAYDEMSAFVTDPVQSDTQFSWNGFEWVYLSRTTYSYSGSNLTESIIEAYDADSASWANTERMAYTYDGGGHVTSVLSQSWSGGGWGNTFNSTMSYSGSVLDSTVTMLWSGGVWVNFRKNVYTYSGGLLTQDVSQAWAGGSWADAERITYSYDGSNRRILAVWQRWGTSGPWTNWYRFEYAYDGSSTREILEVNYDWDTVGDTWNAVWADTSRYSGDNRIELVTYWFQAGFLTRGLYTYDGLGNLIEEVHELWLGFWSSSTRIVHVYIVAGVFDDDATLGVPVGFNIGQNYPNPFNLSTLIPYTLDRDSRVKISVSNILGQSVKTLVDSYQPAGRHQTAWEGRDQNGREVASGIYFFRVQVDGVAQVRKMVLLK